MKTVIATITLLFSLGATAGDFCPPRVPDRVPQPPDGATATEEAMLKAQGEFQDYVATIESYLECRSLVLRDMRHNMLIDRAVLAASSYNRELGKYLARSGMVAQS